MLRHSGILFSPRVMLRVLSKEALNDDATSFNDHP